MIDLSPAVGQAVALTVVGYVSGFLNVVGGGGSLLTLPLMLWMGMPAPVANATNRIALITQNIAATTAFHRGGRLPWRTTAWLLLPTVPAAAFGAWLALDIDETLFRRILVFVMLASLWMVWRQDPRHGVTDSPHARHSKSLWLSFLAMGVYAGFLQAGLGFLIIAALTSLGGLDFVRTNAVKVALVLAGQIVALAIFTAAGTVDWVAGSLLAAGSTAGAWHAARMQIAKGSPWVRRAVIALMIGFTLKLAYEGFVAGANAAGG
jgi:uncharacterized protein